MPESNSAGFVGVIIGGVSFLGGVATSLIGKGKRDQIIDSAVEQLKDLEDVPVKLEEQGKKLASLEEAMKNLASSLVRDGRPTYVTGPVCKEEQGHCRDLIALKLEAGNVRFGVVEADIKEIKASQDTMKASQDANLRIILDEIRKNK